jgi:hypothetical protein
MTHLVDNPCTFCGDRQPCWRYPTPHTIQLTFLDETVAGVGQGESAADWLACDACAVLVDAERWRELGMRVARMQHLDETTAGILMTTFRSSRHPVTPKQPL